MPVGAARVGVQPSLNLYRARYDFAIHGGAIAAIPVGDVLPSGVIVWGGWMEVDTVPTSGGAATLALSIESANDLSTAAVVSGAPWSTTGRKVITPVFTVATMIKTTAARQVTFTPAVATLTAGAIDVFLLLAYTPD